MHFSKPDFASATPGEIVCHSSLGFGVSVVAVILTTGGPLVHGLRIFFTANTSNFQRLDR